MSENLTQAEKVFNIEVEHEGQVKKVSLIARVLDEEERIERDRALVKMASPEMYDNLPVASKVRLWSLVTVRIALKDMPTWLNDLVGKHEELAFALFSEVDALERAYFRRHLEEGTATEERPSFSIITKDVPSSLAPL